eukprot:jgi/Astpho2/5790/Aster-x0263
MICVEGLMASGKSSVIQALAKAGYSVMLEPVSDWQQELALFYEDMSKHALLLQMRIMHSFASVSSFPQIMERSPHASLCVFAKLALDNGHLNKAAFNCIKRWSNSTISKYDRHNIVFVYLHAKTETCIHRMQQRGRECEKDVSDKYMLQLDKAYRAFMSQMAAEGHEVHFIDAERDVDTVAKDLERLAVRYR